MLDFALQTNSIKTTSYKINARCKKICRKKKILDTNDKNEIAGDTSATLYLLHRSTSLNLQLFGTLLFMKHSI